MTTISRRTLLQGSATAMALAAAPALRAQGATKMRLSTAFTEQDLRAEAYKAFGAAMKSDFDLQPFWGNTMFKQGTELVALQRGNLEMANLAPQDISKQLPAWSLLTSAYLFRDAAHLKKTFQSAQDTIAPLSDAQLLEPVKFPFGDRTVTRATFWQGPLYQIRNHYGQLVVYLRMNGIVPPTTARR